MWITCIGSIFIILSTTAMGFWMSEKDRLRVLELRELQRVLRFMGNEIIVFNTIFLDILRKVSFMEELRVSMLFKKIVIAMEERPWDSIEEIWKNPFMYKDCDLHLAGEDIELLISFGITLERSDVEGQMKNLENMITRLKEFEGAANEKYNTNGKLYKNAGLLSGILVSIILF